MKKLITIINIAFVVFLWFSSDGLTANWYVDNAASGTNNGTSWTNAWESFADITWGTGGIVAGDTLYISGGSTTKTYNETLTITESGTSGNPITIRIGQDVNHNGTAIINGGGTRTDCITGASEHYITINGEYNGEKHIKVTNSTRRGVYFLDALGVKVTYIHVLNVGNLTGVFAHGVYLRSARGGAELSYSIVDNAYEDAVYMGGQNSIATTWGDGAQIHHNVITNIGDDGITMSEGNDIYDNTIGPWVYRGDFGYHPDGIQYYGGWNRMYNNIFYDNSDFASNAFIFVDMDGAHVSDHHRIYNNIFFTTGAAYSTNRWVGVEIKLEAAENSIDDIFILNNTFADLGYWAVWFDLNSVTNSVTNVKVINNLLYNCRNSGSGSVLSFDSGDYANILVNSNNIHQGNDGTQVIAYDGVNYSTVTAFNAAAGFINTNVTPVFVAYSPAAGLLNNYHLASSDTSSINRGTDLSLYFSYDKDGNYRTQSIDPNWEIGAYVFIKKAPQPPTNLKLVP